MSKHANQSHESAGRERGLRVARGPRTVPAWHTTVAAPAGSLPPAAPGSGLAAYYRLRCIALEAAVRRLADDLDRERRRFDEVLTRYEQILQERGADPAVPAGRR
jgi:hypothetical protein